MTTVDVALAARLVADQLPHLDGLPLVAVAQGWDNLVVRVGDGLALRLPVREESAPLVRHEARWLAEAVAPLDLATPVPLHVGEATDYYPWPWILTRWIDGTVLADVPLDERTSVVDPLADALLALHRPAPPDAPPNPFRGVALAERDGAVRARIRAWHGDSALLEQVWDRALAAPVWPGPPLWLHGDPHPLNLVTKDGALAGLIDFGDLTGGDPASDLVAAWCCFGADDRARFVARIDASGRYDPHVWTRAAGWAASFASAMQPGSALEPVAHHIARELGAAIA